MPSWCDSVDGVCLALLCLPLCWCRCPAQMACTVFLLFSSLFTLVHPFPPFFFASFPSLDTLTFSITFPFLSSSFLPFTPVVLAILVVVCLFSFSFSCFFLSFFSSFSSRGSYPSLLACLYPGISPSNSFFFICAESVYVIFNTLHRPIDHICNIAPSTSHDNIPPQPTIHNTQY